MAIGKITHGFGGFTQIGSVRVLNRPGGALTMPRQLDIPYPISYQQFGLMNHADGLRFPVLQVPAIPMDQTDPWFTAALLNAWFVTRSAMPTSDLAEIASGIIFCDNGVVATTGRGGWKVLKPKGAGFVLSVEKGQPIGFQMRFAGTDRTATGVSAPAGGIEGTPLEFDAATLGGDLANKGIIGATLQWDTGLTPNMELDGTARPVEQNAGMPTASLSIRMNATTDASPPGWNEDPTAYAEIAGSISIVRESGGGNTVEFSFERGILQNPDDRRQGQGRIIREFSYNLLGGLSAYPIEIADV